MWNLPAGTLMHRMSATPSTHPAKALVETTYDITLYPEHVREAEDEGFSIISINGEEFLIETSDLEEI